MLTDPLAVTYDGSAKSLPRVSARFDRTVYRTADGEFEVTISNPATTRNGKSGPSISLARRLPDPTPGDVFNDFREIRNVFTLTYAFDPLTRAEASVDIPRLRTALQTLVDATLQSRLLAGEM